MLLSLTVTVTVTQGPPLFIHQHQRVLIKAARARVVHWFLIFKGTFEPLMTSFNSRRYEILRATSTPKHGSTRSHFRLSPWKRKYWELLLSDWTAVSKHCGARFVGLMHASRFLLLWLIALRLCFSCNSIYWESYCRYNLEDEWRSVRRWWVW